jgi:hypothetical protein
MSSLENPNHIKNLKTSFPSIQIKKYQPRAVMNPRKIYPWSTGKSGGEEGVQGELAYLTPLLVSGAWRSSSLYAS